jgi:fructose-1,6-bisphosphatase/inositol monophosphatase family enzyme
VPVVAEEEAAAGRIVQVGSHFFLVDPVDGTKEFVKRGGEFTVNIGLIDAGRPVLGAVYAPAHHALYWGSALGVFAEAGPLDIFVSRHYIPPEFEFRADDAAWASTETGVVIRAGAEMRIKVLGANATGAVAAIGTINEPHLGPS